MARTKSKKEKSLKKNSKKSSPVKEFDKLIKKYHTGPYLNIIIKYLEDRLVFGTYDSESMSKEIRQLDKRLEFKRELDKIKNG